METSLNNPEPMPKENSFPSIWELVIQDMQERHQLGIKKYGMPLQPFNGRNALIDAYQEILDLAVYLRQLIYEMDIEGPQKKEYMRQKIEKVIRSSLT